MYTNRSMKKALCGIQTHIVTNIREIIYGGVDGIITTFAVISGFSGAHVSDETTMALSVGVVLLFSVASLCADGISMGLGNLLSLRSEKKLYTTTVQKEQQQEKTNPKNTAQKTVQILKERGFSEEDSKTVTAILQKNKAYWMQYLTREKLGMLPTEDNGIVVKSLFVTTAFIFFGAIPILLFLCATSPEHSFLLSMLGVAVALIVLGTLRSIVTKERIIYVIAEMLCIGSVAGGIAFFVGSLFSGTI